MHPHYRRRPHIVIKALLITILVCLIVALAGLGVAYKYYSGNIKAAGTSDVTQQITIASGDTAHDVALKLEQAGLIKSAPVFEIYARVHKARDQLQAGTYSIAPNQDVASIIAMITGGKVTSHLLTITPGQRLDQVQQTFIKAGYTQAQVTAAFDPTQYQSHPALAGKPATANLEGYLYPDSYQQTSDTKPETIIRQALDQMALHLTPDILAGFSKHGLSVYQGVTLASVIEKEVSNPNDRPIVAQVFLKRLQTGMQLGSDVTAFYGAIIAGATPAVDYDSAYNTRMHPGLPVGPITNVSENSMQAIASPSNTDYLFFVAGDDGVTHFSKTLAEHNAATAQYCKKLCAN